MRERVTGWALRGTPRSSTGLLGPSSRALVGQVDTVKPVRAAGLGRDGKPQSTRALSCPHGLFTEAGGPPLHHLRSERAVRSPAPTPGRPATPLRAPPDEYRGSGETAVLGAAGPLPLPGRVRALARKQPHLPPSQRPPPSRSGGWRAP